LKKAGFKMTKVYIIVLNYNNTEDTIECLNSLMNLNFDDYKILLVDNGSDKEVFLTLRKRYPRIEFLRLSRNYGYALGNNLGIERVLNEAEYVFIVNNDVVVESDVLRKMIECMEKNPAVVACQPIVKYYGSDIIWSAGTQLFFGYPRLYLKNRNCKIDFNFEPPFGLVGCAMLIRVSALRDIGLLDKSLFMMHEETDWCIRAKKKGYRFLVCNSYVYHKVSKTIGLLSKEYLYYVARNWLIVAKKAGFKMFLYALITEPLRILYYFLKLKEKWKIVYYLKGLRDGILGVGGRTII